jgi:Kef-type K+ transport system membrane component KefB
MPSHPDQLLLQLLAIFVSAKVVGELFERIKLPSVLGEILAGAALGPFALGWIHPSDTVNSVAGIGAIFVLFNAGLETSPGDLIRVGRTALLVGSHSCRYSFAHASTLGGGRHVPSSPGPPTSCSILRIHRQGQTRT